MWYSCCKYFSKHTFITLAGLAAVSFGTAYAFYAKWIISLWYFFAALVSLTIYFHFVPCGTEGSDPRRNLGAIRACVV